MSPHSSMTAAHLAAMLLQQAERVAAGGDDLRVRVLEQAPVDTHAAPLERHHQLSRSRRVVKELRRNRRRGRRSRHVLPACAQAVVRIQSMIFKAAQVTIMDFAVAWGVQNTILNVALNPREACRLLHSDSE